ncbi:RluA family pseudouridine synthase [Bacillaceae bacterium SIJ1]|uniref:RluA family pseudouridine synthase n=1 Tax=Litoribacterium kuwaitense TaxID=1398745 RepID=UPI0013E9C67F|nr:RluA family pseudouridine synthase [Litoribacterium kuwaitense]NGP46163.1 RluA family pseudouridine synthase [Litoribacterium kuwaitense]
MNYSRRLAWEIPATAEGMTIKVYLQEACDFSSRTFRTVKKDGRILINGKLKKGFDLLTAGDQLEVFLPVEVVGEHLKPTPLQLDVMYEDEDIIVINKPPGVPSLPPQSGDPLNIAGALLAHYEANGATTAIHLVNRLDRDTSGAMMAAKHKHAHHKMSMQQHSFALSRTYEAIVTGTLRPPSGTIEQPIGMKPGSKVERAVVPGGKHAVTHYKTLSPTKDGRDHLVQVQLETGRTHQIRVHMTWLGHPLLGDTLYGKENDQIERQALHCREMTFHHPITGDEMTIHCPLREDMARLCP